MLSLPVATCSCVLCSQEREHIYNVTYFLEEKASREPVIAPSRAVAQTSKATKVSGVTIWRIFSKLNQACLPQRSPVVHVFSSPTKQCSATVTNSDD